MEKNQSDKTEFKKLWKTKMDIAMANFELMRGPKSSVYSYDPYTRYYLKNQNIYQDNKFDTEKKPDIVERIENIKKRAKK